MVFFIFIFYIADNLVFSMLFLLALMGRYNVVFVGGARSITSWRIRAVPRRPLNTDRGEFRVFRAEKP
jgi:hypothetical protein